MLLEGHEGEIFSCEFHPEGEHLLSTGFDRKIRKFSFIQLDNFLILLDELTRLLTINNYSNLECIR